MTDQTWLDRVRAWRREKDVYFRTSPKSPVANAVFDGVRYYDPDPAYRFRLPLEPGRGDWITLERTAGDTIEYERAGVFAVPFPQGKTRVAAYRTDDGRRELFIPFRDGTSGFETYGAGRYLEAAQDGSAWTVDFNFSYFPFCAYNEAYACPLPPRENWLAVPVRAGERL